MEGLARLGINLPLLLAQIVNFILLFLLLYKFAYKPVLKMLDDRSRKIEESMKQTELIREKLVLTEQESKKRIDVAGKEGQDIIARAGRAGEESRKQAQEDAKKDAQTILARARTEIQQERDNAIGELRRAFAELTVLAAGKVIEKSLDKEAHRQLIDKTLEESEIFNKG